MLNFKILTTTVIAVALSLATGYTPAAKQDQNISEAPSSTAQPVQGNENPSSTTLPTRARQDNLSASDRQFMIEAAQGGLAEVQLGKLASQRGASNAVK